MGIRSHRDLIPDYRYRFLLGVPPVAMLEFLA
jgi:hypothetical protein